ncbi:unnamed protein product, partial [Aureobasidium uvarum]
MDMLHGTFGLAESLLDKLFHGSCEGGQHDPQPTHAVNIVDQPSILRRDVCMDAFGAGWLANTCTPGNTLCCSPRGCYADLNSSCGQPGAVSCTELGAGVDEACCPRYTTCAKGYNATESFVRCDIRFTSLAEIAASSTALSDASTRTSTSSTTTAASSSSASTSSVASASASASSSTAISSETSSTITTPTPNALPKAEPSGNALPGSPGVLLTTSEIVGIVVASAGGVLLLVALAWLLRRRSRSRRKKFAMPTTPIAPPFRSNSKRTSPIMLQSQHGFSELSGSADPVELQSSGWRRKGFGGQKHVSVAGTYELGS